jgi:hypothetical protein
MPQQPGFQRRVAVDRHGKPHDAALLTSMAAADAQQNPAARPMGLPAPAVPLTSKN